MKQNIANKFETLSCKMQDVTSVNVGVSCRGGSKYLMSGSWSF